MGIFRRYAKVEKPLSKTPYASPYAQCADGSCGLRVGVDQQWLQRDIASGKIKDASIPVIGGRISCEPLGRIESGSGTYVDWQIPEGKRDRFSESLAKWSSENVTFSRSFKSGDSEIEYFVCCYRSRSSSGITALDVVLPEGLVKKASMYRVGGYQYGREAKWRRERLFDEVLSPLASDAVSLGFARKAVRTNGKCMTTLCFEQKEFDCDEFQKLIRRMIETEGVEMGISHDIYHDDMELLVAPVAHVHAKQVTPDSYVSNPIIGFLTEHCGMEIPEGANISYMELSETWLGQKRAAMRQTARDLFYSAVGSLDRALGAAEHIQTDRNKAALEGQARLAEWFRKYGPPKQSGEGTGCIMLVDPVCEREVIEGKDPQEKVAAD